jgi:ABC-type Fe3+-hydroxamate transport system substrate-binding protein
MTFTDQTGHSIELSGPPKRIVSIVPSQSELLWDMGLKNELVGITKFCIHPEEMFRTVERVGGTKQLDIEKIRSLKPDLIIGNKEENQKEQIELLKEEFQVWMSDIYDLDDAFKMMNELGEITNKSEAAGRIVNTIKKEFHELSTDRLKGKRAAYLIWYNPIMVAAQNTFIDFILKKLGLINVFEDLKRYPEISAEQLKDSGADIILLSSEPFPFKEKHLKEFSAMCPEAVVKLVDGELFSWYGSRLQYAPSYFRNLAL